MDQALFLMVGGFLGAGKTTAILKLARQLTGEGLRVGLITNDQSVGLVDTALLEAGDFAVEEITGGCFCCRFTSLVEASERLQESERPDVFIAEPVGSCTDLVASVSFPLRRMYGDQYRVAPLSVLVDPIRAERILGLEAGKSFSPKVLYVYQKQLEEAEMVVINKCDLLDADRQERLEAALREALPGKAVLRISARYEFGLEEWKNRLTGAGPLSDSAPEVDYEVYAEGEALLGWVNASVEVTAPEGLDGNELLRSLGARTRDLLAGIEIAHLKMTLMPDGGGDIGVANLVRADGVVEISHWLKDPVERGELLVNLRAEADPEILWESVRRALEACACETRVRHVEHFRPAKPEPTYRMAHI